MKIKQFEDKYLAHYSYAIVSETEHKMILIDPSRNPQPYYDYAREQQAEIVGVIETHPHADFVSGHLEIHETIGAAIYVSKLVAATYAHVPFDTGDVIGLGELSLSAINTPGHSPDSISVVLKVDGKDVALFSGDTLFIGDCGRPDLRESGGEANTERMVLAKQMYASLREKLMPLADEVILYPAHGAGTLCGKALSEANQSTMGAEKITNWSLQEMTEEAFVAELTANQPFIPKYFAYNVQLNKKGAPAFLPSVDAIYLEQGLAKEEAGAWIVDARPAGDFKAAHQQHSINLMNGNKFETWLGSIISPGEGFYLKAADEPTLKSLIARTAAIGYETQVKGAYFDSKGECRMEEFNADELRTNPENYTIVDVRNESEVSEQPIFENSIAIPLGELRERVAEIPTGKPIAVHCAGGYRSAAASSLLSAVFDEKIAVFDIGEAIKDFS